MMPGVENLGIVLENRLLKLYLLVIAGVLVGLLWGWRTQGKSAPILGNFIFWVGAPFTIMVFLHRRELTGWIWLAPALAWTTMGLGAGLGWLLLSLQDQWCRYAGKPLWQSTTKGSFLLAAMAGNTGYLGYPIALTLAGEEYFIWALFFDMLGTALGSYGLGIIIAARYGGQGETSRQLLSNLLKNPPLWSFCLGFWGRDWPISEETMTGLRLLAWGVIFSTLVLIGLRLSRISQWQGWAKVLPVLGIKMLLLPLSAGFLLSWIGVEGMPRLILVLQAGMPPAFATLVLAEVYELDQALSVTALLVGFGGFLLLLPLWLGIFAA